MSVHCESVAQSLEALKGYFRPWISLTKQNVNVVGYGRSLLSREPTAACHEKRFQYATTVHSAGVYMYWVR